jgi:dynein heavy chain, axonemal
MQDLGKALGMQTIVFNCGDALDATFIASFLAGIAQCGAWVCYDEFNRIDVEVCLSGSCRRLIARTFQARDDGEKYITGLLHQRCKGHYYW